MLVEKLEEEMKNIPFTYGRVILDLCGGTGAWSKPYADAGYDVRIITMPDQDVRLFALPAEPIWGILAAPPCDHFSVSGARWWEGKGDAALLEGLSVVDACLRIIHSCWPQWWVLENPVGRLVHYIGKPQMMFDPCDYGDPYTKKTLLWGEFTVPERSPVEPEYRITVDGRRFSPLAYLPPSEGRAEARSITPPGFASAFFEANP